MRPMPRPAYLTFPLVLGALLAALPARAQTEPPPTSPEPATTTAAPGVGSPVGEPPAPPPPPVSAPAPGAAPLPAAPAPAVMSAPGELSPLPPPAEKPPLYKETWFWAVVGVVVLTATMITIGLASQGPSTPNTDLGNMRAF
jgi:hypothetical protein